MANFNVINAVPFQQNVYLRRNIHRLRIHAFIYINTKPVPIDIKVVNENTGEIRLNFNALDAGIYIYRVYRSKDNVIIESGSITVGVTSSQFSTAPITTTTTSGTGYLFSSQSTLFMQSSERGNYFYTSNNTFANATHVHSLNEIANPADDVNFVFGNKGINFVFPVSVSTNATREGAFEIDAVGAFAGDLVHIHQHGSAVANPIDVVHIEGSASSAVGVRIVLSNHTNQVPLNIHGGSQAISISLNSQGVPIKLNQSASNEIVYLNANFLQGKVSSDFALSNHTHSQYMNTSQQNNYFFTSNNTFANNTHIHGNISTASTAGTDLLHTSASNGLTFGVPKWITTAAPVSHTHSDLYMNTSERNNYFYVSANTFANSTHIHGGLVTQSAAGSDLLYTSLSNGLTLGVPKWLTVAAGAGFALQGSGTYTQNSGTIQFANSNNFTFGLTNNQMTASFDGMLTSERGNYFYTSNNTFANSTHVHGATNSSLALGVNLLITSASNGITFGVPGWITTAAQVGHTHSDLYMNVSERGFYFYTSNNTFANSTHIHGNVSTASTAGSNLAVTSASNGITFGVPNWLTAAAGGGFALQGSGTYTQNTGTIQFANGNGLTFGLTNNQMTASYDSTQFALNTHTHGNISLALTNINGTTASASNGMTLSLSVAPPGGGGAVTISSYNVNHKPYATQAVLNNATYSNRPIFVPFELPYAITNLNTIRFALSRTGGTSVAATYRIGVYTLANATSMNLLSSTSFNISLTTSAQFSGIRFLDFTGMLGLSLSPGQYVMGFLHSAAGTASNGFNVMGFGLPTAAAGWILPGTNSTAATASGSHIMPFAGVFNATTSNFPSGVGASSISGGNPGINSPSIWFGLKAI